MSQDRQDNLFSFESFGMKPPLLFVSPDDDYAAVFACNEHVVILESQDGRCVRVRPFRREFDTNPYDTAAQQFVDRGFSRRTLPSDNLQGFVTEFMAVAGFTAGHLQNTYQLCLR